MSERRVTRIVVDIPLEAGEDVTEFIFTAVSDAAYDAEPEDREGWDIAVYSSIVSDE